jgi:alginate O-acetyltransferase complex protein AlgI
VVFNSFQFLLYFPVVLGGYFALPARMRWIWLLVASIYFYGLSQPLLLLQITAATALAFHLARKVELEEDKTAKKRLATIGIVLLVLNLFVFKYTGFVNESLRSVFGWFEAPYPVPVINLILPIGISFYTFQLIGYLVDVLRGAKAERNFGFLSLFVLFFPKLVAGPIERQKNLLPQLHAEHRFDHRQFVLGLQLMLWGFFKKVVVADRIAPFVNDVYGAPQQYDGVAMAFATWLFAFQVYADFSGYTDIAIGAAQTMGIKLAPNFNRPYFAPTVSDFWKRWHISLTSWLTDYIYTPMTRQRVIKVKLYYLMLGSLFVTFVLSGLWHGAQWTFVAWGALHGFYLVFSMLTQKMRMKWLKAVGLDKQPRLHRAMKIAVTFTLVCFAYIFFQARTMSDALYIASHLFSGWGSPGEGFRAIVDGRRGELALALYGIAVLVLVDWLEANGGIREQLAARPVWVRWGAYQVCALSIVVLGAFYASNQTFIYFQF